MVTILIVVTALLLLVPHLQGTESINLYADGVQIPNLTITPDPQDGAWTVTLTVPTDIGPGVHEFTATAVNNGVESVVYQIAVSFTISCAANNRRPW